MKSRQTSKSLVFKVKRASPELIPPATPTPKEVKELSDIDSQEALRFHVPFVLFYRNSGQEDISRVDPAKVLKEALGRALVPYYPLAGRLREKDGGKLVVDCTGEGVLFVEAHADDVSIDDFGEEMHPPFPCFEELLPPVSGGILHSPVLVFQLTKLKCGGFIIVCEFNHTIVDGEGVVGFMKLMANMIHADEEPLPEPIWERHLLCARQPPRVTCVHREFDGIVDTTDITLMPLLHKSFFFGPKEISTLRQLLPPYLKPSATTYEVLSACLWRCRTLALSSHPDEPTRFVCVVNVRSKCSPPIPKGYYGNVLVFPTAMTTVGELCHRPVGYAVELVQKAKSEATDEYTRSIVDLMKVKDRPCLVTGGLSFVVSNLIHIKLNELDFGWGPPVYKGTTGEIPNLVTFYIPYENRKGETGIVFPIQLPALAMERFEKELNFMLSQSQSQPRPYPFNTPS